MSLLRVIPAVLLALLFAGCGSTPDIDPPAELADFTSDYYARTLWVQKLRIRDRKTTAMIQPLVEDDTVYMASDRGRVAAFSRARGRELWKVSIKANVTGGVGSAGRLLLLGSAKGEVIALDRSRGKVVWRQQLTSEVLATPVVSDGIVVARTVDGKLFGLRADSGERVWMYEQSVPSLTLRGLGAPVIAARRVYFGAADGNIVALSLVNGEVVWTRGIATPKGRSELERLVDIDGDLIVRDDIVYAVAYQGSVAALAGESGRVLWSREMSSYSGLALDDRYLYLADDRSVVRALDRQNGETVWTQDALRMRSVTRPVIHGDFVVTADYAGYLHWLARDDGRLIARRRVDEQGVHVAPVVAGETVYASGRSGTLAALQLLRAKQAPSQADRAR